MNKRNILLVLIFAALISTAAGAVELWNGFTSDMDKDQVIARAKTVFESSDFSENTSIYVTYDLFSTGSDRAYLTRSLPAKELMLEFKTSLPQYRKALAACFYIVKGRLFALKVNFTSSANDFLAQARRTYGAPSGTIIETQQGDGRYTQSFQKTWYQWNSPERTILISDWNNGNLFVYDSKVYNQN